MNNQQFESKLLKLLSDSEVYLDSYQKKNTNVSNASVGWQLDHLYRVIIRIYSVLRDSDSNEYQSEFNMKRFVVFNLGKIPRGKGKAPKKSTIDESEISLESLKESLALAKKRVPLFKNFEPNQFFDHPVFGKLNLKNCQKLLLIHTKHHLKIIEDIVKP